MLRVSLFLYVLSILLLPAGSNAQTTTTTTPVEEKVAVLITGWGMPAGYNFTYSYYSSDYPRCGDKTEFEGQPCKIGHVGQLPYMAHINLIPWSICFQTPGYELLHDNSGIYKLEGGMYVSPNPDIPSVAPGAIPAGIPVIPLVEMTQTGKLVFPVDPRDGTDYLQGWYKIGSYTQPYPNGFSDLNEQGPAYYVRYYGHITSPSDPAVWPYTPHFVREQEDITEQMLTAAFGDRVDVRLGFYGEAAGYTKLEWDVAQEFATEGFTKMLLARETTDSNRYANEYMTGNYIKERLCELGVLDTMEIHQALQVGRTPEFNSMNVINLRPFIEAHPEGTTIAMIYATRGLPWNVDETPGWFGRAFPFSKETYFENAYLNYLSWKAAVQRAYGDRYNLVFTRGSIASDLLQDNFFTFGLSEEPDLLGYGGGTVFYSIRNAIQFAKEDGIDTIIVAPCHWNYDNLDTILRMKEINKLPLTPKADLAAEIFEMTHCEDGAGNVVTCGTPGATAEITIAPSYSHRTQEFATAYYVVLKGTLERFGLYPTVPGEDPVIEVSQPVSKLSGGTVQVTSGPVHGSRIVIPADPYPTRPEDFTRETAVTVNDPQDTNDCMWQDTTFTIGYQASPPSMATPAQPVGPAVHFGPYRTFFNRDVTISIPYDSALAGGQNVAVYVYNHVTEGWDPIAPEGVDPVSKLVTFKTKVLGLFQASVGDFDADGVADGADNCPGTFNPAQVNNDSDTYGNACDNCPGVTNQDQADSDLDSVGNVCDNCPSTANPSQRDSYPPAGNVCGDGCECEGNFDGDPDVDGSDAAIFKADFGRSGFKRPCTTDDPCNGDFTCDVDVDGSDAAIFKLDFGRSGFKNPCPNCVTTPWCTY